MRKIKELDATVLHDYFIVDESSPSGLRWRKTVGPRAVKGAPAGSIHTNTCVKCKRQEWVVGVREFGSCKVSRVVWLLSDKLLDDQMVIDHIDGNSLNNSISNLRACLSSDNNRNTFKHRRGKQPGVGFSYNRYRVKIQFKEKHYYVGSYSSVEEACDVYKSICKIADTKSQLSQEEFKCIILQFRKSTREA